MALLAFLWAAAGANLALLVGGLHAPLEENSSPPKLLFWCSIMKLILPACLVQKWDGSANE